MSTPISIIGLNPLTLHAVSTLYFSQPSVGPSIIRPVLQVLFLSDPSFHPAVPSSNEPSHLPVINFLLSDSFQYMKTTLDRASVPLSSSLSCALTALEENTIVKLNGYRVETQADGQKCIILSSLEVLSTSSPKIGHPLPVDAVSHPTAVTNTLSSSQRTADISHYHSRYAFGNLSFPSIASSSSSMMHPSVPPSLASDRFVDSRLYTHQPDVLPLSVKYRPEAASSSVQPSQHTALLIPRLPLELQMMIISECVESYRLDDKLTKATVARSCPERERNEPSLAEKSNVLRPSGNQWYSVGTSSTSKLSSKPLAPGSKPRWLLPMLLKTRSEAREFGEFDESPEPIEFWNSWEPNRFKRVAEPSPEEVLARRQEELRSRTRWALSLVCKTWHEIATPLLYRHIHVTSLQAYALLGPVLSSPTRGPALVSWIKRAVLREVPADWRNPESVVGLVLDNLKDLEVLKIRFVSSESAMSTEEIIGGRGMLMLGKAVWEAYPKLNPKVYHQHHLPTFILPTVSKAWPRLRSTSSEFMFCLTHPSRAMSKFPNLPLKSHHLTVIVAGDPSRLYRLPRLLLRMTANPHLKSFAITVRCASHGMADLVELLLGREPTLRSKSSMDVCWHENNQWVSRKIESSPLVLSGRQDRRRDRDSANGMVDEPEDEVDHEDEEEGEEEEQGEESSLDVSDLTMNQGETEQGQLEVKEEEV
ncbi:Nucleic acid-binding, OB-fold [Phaffia rhodozyma]|uniref:Nucleic acid-binding, OB-fold n=1 Tax=Phaffia rhodozyma TaxID=264483 RepID=A0A0F7SQW0_PHARH|nr:Nucleic acid-binding, OB-fold [Phaffia rhodozyma]